MNGRPQNNNMEMLYFVKYVIIEFKCGYVSLLDTKYQFKSLDSLKHRCVLSLCVCVGGMTRITVVWPLDMLRE